MILDTLSALPEHDEQAVIINVGTKTVTTLALLSALRYAGMPVLVVDCGSQDGSLEHFATLMQTYDFDLLSAPLRKHGQTLDWLFRHIPARKVLLIDSDLELLDAEILGIMRRFIDHRDVLGSGFFHGPSWLLDHPGIGFYEERPWIPLTLLKVATMREGLAAGYSFMERKIYNDFGPSAVIAHALAARFRIRRFRDSKLSWLNLFKRTYYGHRPSYVICDTGADIYQYLKHHKGYEYAGLPLVVSPPFVKHYHGITRRQLDSSDPAAMRVADAIDEVRQRLRDGYGIS